MDRLPSSVEVGYNGAYLRPPRPEVKVPASRFKHRECAGWWVQAKMDGDNSLILVPPDRRPFAYTRHGPVLHKRWQFTEASARPFKDLPGIGWWVFNAELLNKAPSPVVDTNYVHDCLVANGEVLVGHTYASRFTLVDEYFRKYMTAGGPGYFTGPNIWLPMNIVSDFETAWKMMAAPHVEGLVFKHPNVPMAIRDLIPGNHGCDWLGKFRRESKRVPHF